MKKRRFIVELLIEADEEIETHDIGNAIWDAVKDLARGAVWRWDLRGWGYRPEIQPRPEDTKENA